MVTAFDFLDSASAALFVEVKCNAGFGSTRTFECVLNSQKTMLFESGTNKTAEETAGYLNKVKGYVR